MSVVYIAAATGDGSTVLIGLIVVGILLLVGSVILHPYTACSGCKGAPRQFGAVATKSFRMCSVCNGSGREPRILARILGIKR